jgi:hypothetical protein
MINLGKNGSWPIERGTVNVQTLRKQRLWLSRWRSSLTEVFSELKGPVEKLVEESYKSLLII